MNNLHALNQPLKCLAPNLTNQICVASKLKWNESLNRKSFPLVRRNFHVSPIACKTKGGRVLPTVICFQNPITWIMNKLDLKILKSAWDSNFEESEFKRGTKQAVAVICCSLSKSLWDDLRGLVTKQTLIQLKRDVEMNWSSEQRKYVCIDPSDIKLVQTRKVHFMRISDQRFADVDMAFIILKFKEKDPSPVKDIIFFEVFARFHRNYTIGQIPHWGVSQFKVARFHIRQIKDF